MSFTVTAGVASRPACHAAQPRLRRAQAARPSASAQLLQSMKPLHLARRGCALRRARAHGVATRAALGGQARTAALALRVRRAHAAVLRVAGGRCAGEGQADVFDGRAHGGAQAFRGCARHHGASARQPHRSVRTLSVLRAQDPPLEVQRELLYSCACCHAAFGDIEQAWMCLRGACTAAARTQARADACCGADSMEMGLSFDDAQSDPNMMRLEASAQARAARRRSQDACLSCCCASRGAEKGSRARRCATSFASMPRGATKALAPLRARRSRGTAGAAA